LRRAIDTCRHPVYVFHWRGERIKQVVTRRWREEQAKHGSQKVLLHTMRHTALLAEERALLRGKGEQAAVVKPLLVPNLSQLAAELEDAVA
jgi:hypothetical protein